jgi:hypothetical protein
VIRLPFCVLVATLALSTACARAPGPSELEWGEITYWLVTSSDVAFAQCSDASDWRSQVEAPAIEPNTYLIYRVETGGATATAMDCETTLGSSCTESDTGIVFTVVGHTLTWDPTAEIQDVTGSDCDVQVDQIWTLVDNGETLDWELGMAVDLVGDATDCAALDAQIKLQSPNGLGMDGCVVTLSMSADFSHTSVP